MIVCYTIDDFKKGDNFKTIYGEVLEVAECGMIEYPAPLLECEPVPAIISTDGRYFNLAVSGIIKISKTDKIKTLHQKQ